MNKQLIEDLKGRANQIGYWLGAERLREDWSDYNGLANKIWWDFPRNGTLEIWHSKRAKITFSNIRPVKISRSIFHAPFLKNTVIADLNTSVIRNASENITLDRTYSFNEDETTSMSQEAGVDIGIQIRQLIGYGGLASPVSGETEITASINAHYNKTWGSETSTGREISNSISVPPRTEATISVQKSTSDFEQKAEYWCELDYDISIASDHDYNYKFGSRAELEQVLSGLGNNKHPLSRTFRDNPINREFINNMIAPITTRLEETIKFSNASTGNVRITERKL